MVAYPSLLPTLSLSSGAVRANISGRCGIGASCAAVFGWKGFSPAGLSVAASVPPLSAGDCRRVLLHVAGQGPVAPPAHTCQRLRQRQPVGLLSCVECRSLLLS